MSAEVSDSLESSSGASGQRGASQVGCWGRVFKHWSQYCFVCSELVTLTGTTYGFVAKEYLLGGAFVVASLSPCLAFWYVRKFRPEKSLEDRVRDLGDENTRLQGSLTKLEKFKKDIQKSLGAAELNLSETRKLLQEKLTSFDEVTKRLGKTQKELEKLERLYKRYKEDTRSIAQSVAAFNLQHKELHQYIDGMDKQIEGFGRESQDLEVGVAGLDRENAEMLAQTEDLGKLLKGLQQELDLLETVFTNMGEQFQQLKGPVEKLDEMDDKFVDGSKRVNEASERLQKTLQDALEVLGDADEESES